MGYGTAVALLVAAGFGLIGPYSLCSGAFVIDFGGKKSSATASALMDGSGALLAFVIMLLNLEQSPRLSTLSWPRALAFIGGVCVLALLLSAVATRADLDPAIPLPADAVAATSVENLGVALLTTHAFSLEIVGALLLAATIGAVLLAKKRFV